MGRLRTSHILGSAVGTIDGTLVSVLTRIDYYGRYYATYQKVEPVLAFVTGRC